MVKLTTRGLISDKSIILVDVSGTAINATNSTIVDMPATDISADSFYYPTFVREVSGGFCRQYINTGFKYNPKTNTVTTTNVVANSSATTINVSTISTDTVYPTFVTELGNPAIYASPTKLNYIQSSNTLNANISGIAANATKIFSTRCHNVGGIFYVNFVGGSSDGYYDIRQDQTLNYDPSTGTLSATNFSGNCTGTISGSVTLATNATNVNIQQGTTTREYYPIFVTDTTGYCPNYVNNAFSYNPDKNTLTVGNIVGTLNGSCTGSSGSCTGTALFATTAGSCTGTAVNATNIIIQGTGTATTNHYITFVVNSAGTGAFPARTDAQLYFTPNTNTLTSGKFNASGSDFAEHMTKKNGSFQFEAGDICGIDRNGLLTNIFSESFHFCVKSKNPAIIAKGNEEKSELTEAIAFCGQVPVNVFHCRVGDYIVPIESEGGMISGTNISSASISFGQYKDSIGKVIRINADGTAEIIVKIV